MERKERFTPKEKKELAIDGESPDLGITRRDFGRRFILAIAVSATACSGFSIKRDTITKSENQLIVSDERKRKIVKKERMIIQCGPKNEIDSIEADRCEANIKRTRKKHLSCIECTYEEEVLD